MIDRNRITIKKITDPDSDDAGYVDASYSERLSMIWELTKDAWAFAPNQDAEQRLQRHVVVLTRRKG